MEFYNEDALQYETKMLQLPFWKAFDRTYLRQIERFTGGGGTMLEVGGGTGRISLPLATTYDTILSFDIAEAMVRTAMRKRAAAGEGLSHVHYFVADAENIPVRSASIDVAIFSGILHHVENPDRVLREVARALVEDGRYVGSENNRSAFRPVFDALMRVRRLWNEKAHEEHFVLSKRELQQWTLDAGLTATVWTSVFAPPHLFNLASTDVAVRLLEHTDTVCRSIPWLRDQGGLVMFAGAKSAGGSSVPRH
jgi:ubiquinone/menaquinone biosynthesis C-methylase UbiE